MMGLFGSVKSAHARGISVSVASASGGGTTVTVNGQVYGIARRGRQRSEDQILVSSELVPDARLTEAMVALMAALDSDDPQRIAELVAKFRESKLPV